MNHIYHYFGRDYILDDEEHKKVLEAIKRGQTMMILRDGDLILNVNQVQSVSPTYEATEAQKVDKQKLALPPAPEKPTTFFQKNKEAFYKKMGWQKGR